MKNSPYFASLKSFSSSQGSILSAILLLCLIGCQAAPSEDSSSSIPQPPDETAAARLIYSPDPTFIDAETFHQSLTELSDQITLLYILASERSLPAEELDAIILMQKRFYRYGLRVMLLDRNPSQCWPELKEQLETAGANFPVAYTGNSSDDWLSSYLQTPGIFDNQLYIVDAGSLRVKVPRPWTPMVLSKEIKQTLTSRSSSDIRQK